MNWSVHHSESEIFAAAAEVARRAGDSEAASKYFAAAGLQEARALRSLGSDQPRTFGVTAVSATALFYKANAFTEAEEVAGEALKASFLPDFAKEQIEDLMETIRNERSGRSPSTAISAHR